MARVAYGGVRDKAYRRAWQWWGGNTTILVPEPPPEGQPDGSAYFPDYIHRVRRGRQFWYQGRVLEEAPEEQPSGQVYFPDRFFQKPRRYRALEWWGNSTALLQPEEFPAGGTIFPDYLSRPERRQFFFDGRVVVADEEPPEADHLYPDKLFQQRRVRQDWLWSLNPDYIQTPENLPTASRLFPDRLPRVLKRQDWQQQSPMEEPVEETEPDGERYFPNIVPGYRRKRQDFVAFRGPWLDEFPPEGISTYPDRIARRYTRPSHYYSQLLPIPDQPLPEGESYFPNSVPPTERYLQRGQLFVFNRPEVPEPVAAPTTYFQNPGLGYRVLLQGPGTEQVQFGPHILHRIIVSASGSMTADIYDAVGLTDNRIWHYVSADGLVSLDVEVPIERGLYVVVTGAGGELSLVYN